MTARAGTRPKNRFGISSMRTALWLLLLLAGVMAGVSYQAQALAIPFIDHLMFPYDADHWRRLAQVRAWLDGGHFTDVIVPGTNAPDGGIVRHWSRAIDIAIAGFVKLMPSSMTLDQRLMSGGGWYFVAVCLALTAFLERAASRTGAVQVLFAVVFLGYFNAGFDGYFALNNVDHHNALCMLWACVLMLMMNPPDRGRAALLGFVLGLMLWISVEALVVIGFVYALLGAHALLKPERAEIPALTATAAALVAAAAMVAERPETWASYVVYDAMSVVHVTLLSLCAAAAWAAWGVSRRLPSPRAYAVAGALAGAGVLLGMGMAFPKFFGGPRVDADPFIFEVFLPSITESRRLFDVPYQTAFSYLWQPALAAAALWATRKSRLWQRNRWRQAVLCVALAVSFCMLLTGTRWVYYIAVVVLVVLGTLLPVLAIASRFFLLRALPRKYRPAAVLWTAAFAATVFTTATGQEVFDNPCVFYQRYAVQAGQVQAALGDEPLVLFALPTTAGFVNFFTPYDVIAGNYDREVEGMKDVHRILYAETAAEAWPVLERRKVGAAMICPTTAPEESWIRGLPDPAKRPAWMEFVKTLQIPGEEDAEKLPLVFRVNRS